MSAVAWDKKLSSRNPRAQVLVRLLSWWETAYRLQFSASHVAGVDNVRNDAGSLLSANQSYATLFSSLTSGWTQDPATVDVQGLADIWRHISELTLLPTPRALKKWYVWCLRSGISTWLVSLPLAVQVQHISNFVLHGFQFGYGSDGPIRSDTILAVPLGVRHSLLRLDKISP
ncbi:hypothetical protein PHMEG_00011525 [Phytophthora megakarya]|uniref:Uncharacterized protein n=1 Tax=Phytophthora megakarya TaxID=4795 RepID=A0A225WB08_9STRA|nr:hypothetical protein PHMEG_00011525 [Phytophthora megakarya]